MQYKKNEPLKQRVVTLRNRKKTQRHTGLVELTQVSVFALLKNTVAPNHTTVVAP